MLTVAQPATAEELAECVRAAHAEGLALTPWGAGTLQHLGRPPAPEALRLELAGLGRVLEHTPADLTISVEAGATLAADQGWRVTVLDEKLVRIRVGPIEPEVGTPGVLGHRAN